MFFNGNWSRMSPLSENNEQVILAQICKLKLEVNCSSKVMKRCKAEYLLIKMILLKSLICKDLPFTLDYSDYQRKCLPCIHYMHLDGYFSVIWKAVTLLIL